MRHALTFFTALALLGAAPLAVAGDGYSNDPAHHVYDESRDAAADVAAALALIQGTDKRVVVALGANWCHDSRGLARHLQSEVMTPILVDSFEVVWVDVDTPQMGMARNQELATRFGITPLEGTPTVVVLDADGNVLNSEADARRWRNADSFSTEEVFADFTHYSVMTAAAPEHLGD